MDVKVDIVISTEFEISDRELNYTDSINIKTSVVRTINQA